MSLRLRSLALTCGMIGALFDGVQADSHVWKTLPSGDWAVAANWDINAVPVAGDRADVGLNHSGCTANLTDARSVQDVYAGLSSTGTVAIQSSGDLDVSRYCVIGYSYNGLAGSGRALVAGRLSAPYIYVGYGTQVGSEESGIEQSGGAVTSSVTCYMGNSAGARSYFNQYGGVNYFQELALGHQNGTHAAYTITNGSLTAANLTVGDLGIGATGILTVSGAANVMAPNGCRIGNKESQVAHLSMEGGRLTAKELQVGYLGACTAGLTISGGLMSITNAYLGWAGAGSVCTVNQSGGTNRILAGLTMGVNAGSSNTYTLSGGLLETAALAMCTASNQSYLVQNGGANCSPTIKMGSAAGAQAVYAIAGGTLTVTNLYLSFAGACAAGLNISGGQMSLGDMYMGWAGAGSVCTVNQSGGTNRVVNALQMGVNSGSYNAYTVSGGLLDAGTIYVGGSYVSTTTGMLAYAGGEIRANTLTFKEAPKVVGLRLTLPPAGLKPIVVANTATLNGTLAIERASNYSFAPGTVITAMTYNARSGAFTQTNLLGGMTCRLTYDVDVGGGRKAITLDQLRPLPPGTVVCIR
ncbi:MAG: hypothetical protein PHR35_05070 [Kiritimatiellae bacterium]|nr:hypothetical protein [Kiritimatiellia bacterium]